MKNTSTWWIKIPLIFFLIFGLTEFFVDSGELPAFIKYPMVQVFLVFILFLLIVIAIITRAIENVMFQTLSKEGQERYIAAKNKSFQWEWGQKTYQKMLGSKPIEKEGEIILDHNYDGIRELDNNLPPWWVYLFYASIVFGVVYLLRFHVFNDYTQDQEYEQEVAAAQLEIEAYKKTAKGLVDANTVELLTDASDISAGKSIFESNCVACHMTDGGGGIGPNLTDKNWILGGGIKNVFHTISEGGRDGKGMIAWKQNLKPAEIAQVASYVLSFQGTTPANPKAPEGDVWADPNAPEQTIPATETNTEQEIDSTSVSMN
ncbi:cbb3-type cytochrome c oxidase N-terminal domain-containing protein [Zobellia roscoffensis]|uniref:cbb3-type cytochrome c oxidase N-terminal domain-containing protein n=1 Tax=Zobellia roscoffensis TaxID=2779508 RepID=UPI00188B7E89|nr:cbb3-type cytochrome c oxidase N-terminal domain-containing protein [Zobellia roscoffensis]